MDHAPAAPARPGGSSDVFLFFLASFIWGTTWLAIKFQLGVVAPGALLGVAGVALLFWPEVAALQAGAGQLRGLLLALVATFFASAGNLYSQRLFRGGMAVAPSIAFAMGYAALAVMAWCAATGVPFTFDARPGYVLFLAYLALFGSVVAFMAFLTLLKRMGAGRSGYTAAVIPLIAMLASTAFEGYRWSAAPLAGMLLVLSGTVLVLRAKERIA